MPIVIDNASSGKMITAGTVSRVLLDAVSEVRLLNRYTALVKWRKFDTSRIESNTKILEEKNYIKIQWRNIITDIRGIFANPFYFIPRVAFSLIAFIFIIIKHYEHAIFFMAPVAFDAGKGSSTNGDNTAVTWTHTVTGSNPVILISTECLNGTTSAKYNGNSLTNAIAANTPRIQEQVFYAAGIATGLGTAEVDSTSASPLCGCAISLINVNQASSIGATSSATSGTNSTLITTVDGNMRVDFYCVDNESSGLPTASLSSGTGAGTGRGGANQFNEFTTAWFNPQPTAGSNTYNWTVTNSGVRQGLMAVEVKPTVVAAFQTFKTLTGAGNI